MGLFRARNIFSTRCFSTNCFYKNNFYAQIYFRIFFSSAHVRDRKCFSIKYAGRMFFIAPPPLT